MPYYDIVWDTWPDPADSSKDATEFACTLEQRGDYYLTYYERIWIDRRRRHQEELDEMED